MGSQNRNPSSASISSVVCLPRRFGGTYFRLNNFYNTYTVLSIAFYKCEIACSYLQRLKWKPVSCFTINQETDLNILEITVYNTIFSLTWVRFCYVEFNSTELVKVLGQIIVFSVSTAVKILRNRVFMLT